MGGPIGYLLSAVDWQTFSQTTLCSSEQTAILIVLFLFSITLLVTMLTAQEHPLKPKVDRDCQVQYLQQFQIPKSYERAHLVQQHPQEFSDCLNSMFIYSDLLGKQLLFVMVARFTVRDSTVLDSRTVLTFKTKPLRNLHKQL